MGSLWGGNNVLQCKRTKILIIETADWRSPAAATAAASRQRAAMSSVSRSPSLGTCAYCIEQVTSKATSSRILNRGWPSTAAMHGTPL